MKTLTCSLTFSDGQTVTATIHAESPQGDYPIQYTGQVERIKDREAEAGPFDMRPHFRTLAKLLHARFDMSESGAFDNWAE